MVERLNEWLTHKDYFKGVVLYSNGEHNAALLQVFKSGPSPYNIQLLERELRKELERLKINASMKQQGNPAGIRNVVLKELPPLLQKPAVITVEETPPANDVIYQAAKAQADKRYKEAMNLRAQLFGLANMNDFLDVNTPDRIEARRQMSLDVVRLYKEASSLYEKADYIKSNNGKLPDEPDQEKDMGLNSIPDHLVKQHLDNVRKNYNKMKKRAQTPERVALMQKHAQTIQILSQRWDLLKQQ